MKTKKKLLLVALALAMIIGVVSAFAITASAGTVEYQWYKQSVKITNAILESGKTAYAWNTDGYVWKAGAVNQSNGASVMQIEVDATTATADIPVFIKVASKISAVAGDTDVFTISDGTTTKTYGDKDTANETDEILFTAIKGVKTTFTFKYVKDSSQDAVGEAVSFQFCFGSSVLDDDKSVTSPDTDITYIAVNGETNEKADFTGDKYTYGDKIFRTDNGTKNNTMAMTVGYIVRYKADATATSYTFAEAIPAGTTAYTFKDIVNSGLTKTGYELVSYRDETNAYDTVTSYDLTGNVVVYPEYKLKAPSIQEIFDSTITYDGTEYEVTASPVHELSSVTYSCEWQKKSALGEWNTVDNDETLNFTTVSDSGKYRLKLIAHNFADYSDETISNEFTVTVKKATIYVDVVAQTIIYGQAFDNSSVLNTTYTVRGIVNADAATVTVDPSKLSLKSPYNTTNPDNRKVGEYRIGVIIDGAYSADGLANYIVAIGNYANLTVNAKTITINITDATKAYNGNTAVAKSELTVDDFTAQAEYGDSVDFTLDTQSFWSDKNAGTKTLTVKPVSTDSNYTFTEIASLNVATGITKKNVTLTAYDEITKVYDGNNSCADQTLASAELDGLVPGETLVVNISNATFDNENVATAIKVNATVTLADGTGDADNYQYTGTTELNASIKQATLTLTLPILTVEYGAALPTGSITAGMFSGFVNGEDASAIEYSGTTYTVDPEKYTLYANIGEFNDAIILGVGAISGGNYKIEIVLGKLTVTTKEVTVGITSVPDVTYGDAVTVIAPVYSYTGFVNSQRIDGVGDEAVAGLTGAAGFTTAYTAGSFGTGFTVTPTAGNLAATNYTFTASATTATVDVAKKTVTLTWPGNSICLYYYNKEEIKPEATLNGVLPQDTEVELAYSAQPGATNADRSVTYTTTVSGLTGTNSDRYTLTGDTSFQWRIIPRKLFVTFNNATVEYGTDPSAITLSAEPFTLGGGSFAKGDSYSDVVLGYEYYTSNTGNIEYYTATSPVGSTFKIKHRTINPNYEIESYNTGTLTVGKQKVTISAMAGADIQMEYCGTATPDSLSTLVKGSDFTMSADVAYSYTVAFNSANVMDADTVTITFTITGADADNYEFVSNTLTFTNGVNGATVKITPKTLSVAAAATPIIEKVYDATNTVGAELDATDYTFTGAIETPVITYDAVYNSVNATDNGGATKVILSNIALEDNGTFIASNYNLITATFEISASIERRLVVIGVDKTKLYSMVYGEDFGIYDKTALTANPYGANSGLLPGHEIVSGTVKLRVGDNSSTQEYVKGNDAGTYYVQGHNVTVTENNNYTIRYYVGSTYTVGKRTVALKLDTTFTKEYGNTTYEATVFGTELQANTGWYSFTNVYSADSTEAEKAIAKLVLSRFGTAGTKGDEKVNIAGYPITITEATLFAKGIEHDKFNTTNYTVEVTYPDATGTTTFTITKKTIDISNEIVINDKVYDGTANATVNDIATNANLASKLVSWSGVTDTVSVSIGTLYFGTSSVGENVSVTIAPDTVTLAGDDKDNYQLSSVAQRNTSAQIKVRPVKVSGITASDKVYDGNNVAAINVNGVIFTVLNDDGTAIYDGGLSLNAQGLFASNSLSVTGCTGTFASKDVALSGNAVVAQTVTFSNYSLGSTSAGNYVIQKTGDFASQTTTDATINQKNLKLNSFAVSNKVYDTNTDATITSYLVTGQIGSEGISIALKAGETASFDTKDYSGTAKTVTIDGLDKLEIIKTATANDLTDLITNYYIDATSALTSTAYITKKDVLISGVTIGNMIYNGTKIATDDVIGGTVVIYVYNTTSGKYDIPLTTFAPADTVGHTVYGEFASKDVQYNEAKEIIEQNVVISLSLSGGDAGNYNLTNASFGTQKAKIVPATLIITPTDGQNKIYGEADPDAFTFSSAPATTINATEVPAFEGKLSRNEGENRNSYAITIGTLKAVDNVSENFLAGNYVIEMNSSVVYFEITARRLNVMVTAGQSKVYGEADPAEFAYTYSNNIEGEIPGFAGNVTRAPGEVYNSLGYSYNLSGLTLVDNGTFKANNYEIYNDTAALVTFMITKRTIVIKADSEKIYNNADFEYTLGANDADNLVAGDAITAGAITTNGKDVKNYNTVADFTTTTAIVIKNAALLDVTDCYIIEYVDSENVCKISLEITAAPITITVTDEMQYNNIKLEVTVNASMVIGNIYGEISGSVKTVGVIKGVYDADDEFTSTVALSDGTANYAITYTVSLTINANKVTLTVNDNKDYDGAALVSGIEKFTNNLVAGDAFTAGALTTTGVNVKDYTAKATDWTITTAIVIKHGEEDRTACYEFDTDAVSLEITAKTLTITLDQTKEYNGSVQSVLFGDVTAAEIDGLVDGETLSAGKFTIIAKDVAVYTYGVAPEWTVETAAAVKKADNSDSTANYSIVYAGTIEITKATLTVEITEVNNKYYDGTTAITGVVAKVNGAMGGDLPTVAISDAAWTNKDAGTAKTIGFKATLDSAWRTNYILKAEAPDYEITLTEQTVTGMVATISPANVKITYVANVFSKSFDDTHSISPKTGLDYVYTIVTLPGEGAIPTGEALTADCPNIMWNNPGFGSNSVDVGDYTKDVILKSANGDATNPANYKIVYSGAVPCDAEIQKANLMVIPTLGQFKIYGDTDSAFTYDYVRGTLAQDGTWSYSAELNKTFDADVAGFTGALEREAGEDKGYYAYNLGNLALTDNNTFNAVDYNLVLNALSIPAVDGEKFEIKAKQVYVVVDADKMYDGSNFIYTLTDANIKNADLTTAGLVGADTIFAGQLETTDKAVKDYTAMTTDWTVKTAIVIKNGALEKTDNYELIYVKDETSTVSLEITPAKLQVVANVITVIYGDEKPTLTYTITGVVGTEKLADIIDDYANISDLIVLDASYGVGTIVGTYQINVIQNTATIKNANYEWADIKSVDSTLNVEKKDLKLVIDNVTVTYGNDIPAYTISGDNNSKYTFGGVERTYGFVANDSFASLTLDAPAVNFTCAYGAGSNVGEYPITNSQFNKLSSTNYNIIAYSATEDIKAGKVTVEKYTLYVTPATGALSKTYGEADPTLDFTIAASPVAGEIVKYTGTISRAAGENAGKYAYTLSITLVANTSGTKTFNPNNFVVAVAKDAEDADLMFVINKAKLTITGTSTDATRVYDATTNATATLGTVNGIINNAIVADDATKVAVSVTASFADKNAANGKTVTFVYTITGTSEKNYEIDEANSTMTVTADITPKAITVSGFTAEDKIYDKSTDATLNNTALTFSGILAGDNLGATATGKFNDKNVAYDEANVISKVVKITNIVLTGNDAGNYSVKDDSQTETSAKITPKKFTFNGITAVDKVYDGLNTVKSFVYDKLSYVDLCEGDIVSIIVEGEYADVNVKTEKTKINFTKITVTGADAGNYYYDSTNSQKAADAFITKAPLTITFAGITAVYGDAIPAIPAPEYVGFVNGETAETAPNFTVGTAAVVGFDNTDPAKRGVKTYDITVTGYVAVNYELNIVAGKLEITKKDLEVTIADKEVTYGDPIPVYTWTFGTFAYDEDSTVLGGTLTPYCAYAQYSSVVDGGYAISGSGLLSDNYNIIYNAGTLTVNKAIITFTANNNAITYGDAPAANGYTFDGLLGSDKATVITGTVGFTFSYNQYDDATTADGANIEYAITPDVSGLTATNYKFEVVDGVLTVNKYAINGAVNINGKVTETLTYGDATPAYTVAVAEALPGNHDNFATDVLPYVVFNGKYEQRNDAGDYTVSATLSHVNYTLTATDATLKVNAKALTVTADNKTVIYGDNAPAYTATYTGLTDWDKDTNGQPTGAAFTNGIKYVCEYVAGTGVGAYEIDIKTSDLANSNYTISFVNGELTVNKKALTVKADDKTVIYGEALPEFTITIEGFVLGEKREDVVDESALVIGEKNAEGNGYVAGDAAGSVYTITATGLTAKNYSFPENYDTATLTVLVRPIKVQANDKTIVYGHAADEEAYPDGFTVVTEEGFYGIFGDDDLGISYTYGDYAAGKQISTDEVKYYIIPAATNANYSFEYVNGNLTVAKRKAIVTVQNSSAEYGNDAVIADIPFISDETILDADLAGMTITYKFFKLNGEEEVEYVAGDAVGEYQIKVIGIGNNNYEFEFVNGVFTVTKRVITITANNNAITYGDEAADNGYTADKTLFGEDVFGGEAVYTFTTVIGEETVNYDLAGVHGVGEYTIGISGLTADADKYEIVFSTGKLTVGKAALTVSIDSEIFYNDAFPEFNITFEGFVNGETDAIFDGQALVYTCGYVKGNNVGKYPVTVSEIEGEFYTNANYDITFKGELTVKKVVLTVKVSADNENGFITYGDATPAYKIVEITGFVNDELRADVVDESALIFICAYDSTDAASRNAGKYVIDASGLAATNYSFEIVGELEVKQKALVIKANDGSVTYGEDTIDIDANGYTAEGFVYGETIADLGGAIKLSCEYVKGMDAGKYDIVSEGFTSDNYAIEFKNGTLNVAKKVLTFYAYDYTIQYGDDAPKYTAVIEGYTNKDTYADLGGSLNITSVYGNGSQIGVYEIEVINNLTSNNYEIVEDTSKYANNTNAILTVNPREITITADNKSVVYGDNKPAFTLSVGGKKLAYNDTIADIGAVTYTCVYGAGTPVKDGGYAITIAVNNTNANYNVTVADGILTVTPKELVIIPIGTSKLVGTDDKSNYKFHYSGVLAGEIPLFEGTLGRVAGEELGDYDFTLGTLAPKDNIPFRAKNYKLVIIDNADKFSITNVGISNFGQSLSFKDQININYYFDIKTSGDVTLVNGGILEWTEEQFNTIESFIYDPAFTSKIYTTTDTTGAGRFNFMGVGQSIKARDYGVKFYTRAYIIDSNGDYIYGDIVEYSVVDYVNIALGQTDEARYGKLKTLVVALVEYGSAAQVYLNDAKPLASTFVDADKLAAYHKDVDASMKSYMTDCKPVDGALNNLAWNGISTSFYGAFKLNFFGCNVNANYNEDNFGMIYWTAEEYAAAGDKLDPETAHKVENIYTTSSGYSFTIDGIAARKGIEVYYAAMWVKDAEGNISYSTVRPGSIQMYATLASEKSGKETLKVLGNAVLVYLAAAHDYLSSK